MTLCSYVIRPQRNLHPPEYCDQEAAVDSVFCPMHREEIDPDAARARDLEGW